MVQNIMVISKLNKINAFSKEDLIKIKQLVKFLKSQRENKISSTVPGYV